MKIGLVGPTGQQRSLPFNAERTVNLYPVLDQRGKEVSALYGTPGLSFFTTAGSGPIRASFTAANGRSFFVSGTALYEVTSTGTATSRGALSGDASLMVSIAENGFELAICDSTYLYILNYTTNLFTQISDVDLVNPDTVEFLDGYFVVNKKNTGQFNISGLFNGLTWAALDFATAESSPDSLLRCVNAVGQLWLFGDKTTEIWTNTGNSVFPFQRISGAKMETGISSPHSAIAIDNSVFWVGKDNIGLGIVYRASGFSPKRISTEAVELIIQSATDITKIRGYTYQQDGHVFYVLTGGGLPTTLVYDISTNMWHERAYLNTEGEYEQHLGSCCTFAFSKQLVGDRRNGTIYEMGMSFYSDNGDEILRERTYTHISNENEQIRFKSLELALETGVSLSNGQGDDAQIMLQLSKDGARTWSDIYTTPMGRIGKYETIVRFRRLGITGNMTFRIRISDPVKVSLIGSYLK